jgi:hypothetical protein
MKNCTKKTYFLMPALLSGLVGTVYHRQACDDAWARPFRLSKIPKSELGCGTCHIDPLGGGARNNFGRDYATIGIKAGERYSDELASMDSDGDGHTNAQEFEAGTHPGDPVSKPAK